MSYSTEMPDLKPCPFCGGDAYMELVERGSGLEHLAIFVRHSVRCPIYDKNKIVYGYINFEHESDHGRIALSSLERSFAKQWNRRACK